MEKKRLDVLLRDRGFFPTREKAQAAILERRVYVDGKLVVKAGTPFEIDRKIRVIEEDSFVSRGGYKLEKALEEFGLKVEGRIALDVGASTGGFTHCLLRKGARKVIAIDVGYGQFAWKLRQDPRVILLERTNIRTLPPEKVPYLSDFVAIDLSFISVKKVFANIKRLIKKGAEIVVLIKPQFEAGRSQVGKGGIIRDPEVHKKVLFDLWEYFIREGFVLKGLSFSPLKGSEGNIEFLAYLVQGTQKIDKEEIIREVDKVVVRAHEKFSKI